MVRIAKIFIILILFSIQPFTGFASSNQIEVRVAIYNNYPFVFTSSSNDPQGLYIELLERIALQNNWKLTYTYVNFRDAIQLLRTDEVDLIPAVGYSEGRDSLFLFNNELIYLNWGVVYTSFRIEVNSIIDLDGYTIGLKYGDIHAVDFHSMVNNFHLNSQIRWFADYDDMRFALRSGHIDAALFNRAYGQMHKQRSQLYATPVILNPVKTMFAGNMKSRELISIIDHEIGILKTNHSADYQQLIDKWINPGTDYSGFQRWLYVYAFLFLLIIAVSLVLLNFFLKRRFEEKSAQLESERVSRQDIEKRMEISEKEKAMILNSVSDLVLFLSPENQVLWANNHFCDTFKKSINDVKGKTFNEVVTLEPCESILTKNVALHDAKTMYQEYTFSDQQKVYKATVNAVFNENDQFKGYVKTMTDITLQKHVENQLLRAKEKAEESDKLKSAFLANMSHEIRTPMNAIIGFSELLEFDDATPDEKNDYLKIIRLNGQHLMMLISDILVFSQIETGQLQIVRTSLKIKPLLYEVYNQFMEDIRRRATSKDVELKLSFDLAEEVEIYTDPLRLRQILYNLMSNAIKFTKKGSITIGCRGLSDQFLFFVKDTGIGIPAEKKEMVFKRFEQIHKSNAKKHSGTGLGLAICRELVYLLGGRIWVTSQENKGSTFIFKLPK